MSDLSRRNFLKTAGTATGGALLAGCSDDPHPYQIQKPPAPGTEGWAAGEERHVASICSQCFAGCGIRVRVVEGRAVKIEGNPACPVNEGGLGPKGQAGVHVLYHPDRVRQPLRRDGDRGSGRWKPVSWEQAIREIADQLRQLRDQGQPRGLVVLDGEPRGLMPELWARFLEAFGSPNHVNHRSATDGGTCLAMTYMQGVAEQPAYDLHRVSYILGFGENLLESSCQTIHLIRAASRLGNGTFGRRRKFVQVSPGFSVTAAKADEWIPLKPGTYGALALGLAHVLVRDRRYDEAFVTDHTFGFEDWTDADGQAHRGFRDLVLEDYAPAKVAGITGVLPEMIERLAHEAAAHRPAIALADSTAAATTNGLGTAMAIHALNALLGSLERPGGVLVQRPAPLAPWPSVEHDEVARQNLSAPRLDGAGTAACPLGDQFIQGLPEAILAGSPYPAQALFFYRSNPVFSKPEGQQWIEAIRKVPLVVSFSPLPDESTFWADFILPDHTYLERWEIVEPAPSTGYPVVGLRQPAVAPLCDTMATGEVLVRLARAMGPPVSEALAWADFRAAVLDRLQGLLEAETGSVTASNLPEFVRKLEAEGGWWESEYAYQQWEDAFKTKSGKFEFYSQAMAERLAKVFPDAGEREMHLQSVGVATRRDDLCLPHWEPPQFIGDVGQYPFLFLPYRSIDYAEGGARHLPLLRELPEAAHGGGWSDPLEMHPDDASELGLRDGESVWVESPVGRVKMEVILLNDIRPGTVGRHLGHGDWPPQPTELEAPGNTRGLAANASDPLAGILAWHGTRVRIEKGS
ncbi:MAG: molybdopterin-dependent oxidoreductase [Pirellulaceae bacterium]